MVLHFVMPTCYPCARRWMTPTKLTPWRTLDDEWRSTRPASRHALCLESALDASLRNGNGGAMRVWREREIGRLGHASGGAIRPKICGLGSKNQPSGIFHPTGNNSTSVFSRFPRGPATECAVRAAVPAAPRRAARGLRWGRAEPTGEEQHIGTAGRSEEMTLVDGEKAVERALDAAADGGGGSPVLRMRGPGREDTGLPISRESREPRAESREPRRVRVPAYELPPSPRPSARLVLQGAATTMAKFSTGRSTRWR